MISSLLSESFGHLFVLGNDRLDFCLESMEAQAVFVAIPTITVFHILDQVIVLGLPGVDLVKKGLDAQFIVGLACLLFGKHLHQVSVIGLTRVNSVQESFKIFIFLLLLILLFHLLHHIVVFGLS